MIQAIDGMTTYLATISCQRIGFNPKRSVKVNLAEVLNISLSCQNFTTDEL